ncbi:hypothetical protein V6N13_065873 [Hibiscus sabdariffa]|uniref:Uncharacterized protein n=2 Tax=Hibiscus sabdariffa TaxID=183260 RepID=A0ABR2A039_9ROSI
MSGVKKKGNAPFRILNLGNTSPVKVSELVNILERHLIVKAKRNIVDMPGMATFHSPTRTLVTPKGHSEEAVGTLSFGSSMSFDLETATKPELPLKPGS